MTYAALDVMKGINAAAVVGTLASCEIFGQKFQLPLLLLLALGLWHCL
jgi:hypothetical protein